jgi:hypothetical protein
MPTCKRPYKGGPHRCGAPASGFCGSRKWMRAFSNEEDQNAWYTRVRRLLKTAMQQSGMLEPGRPQWTNTSTDARRPGACCNCSAKAVAWLPSADAPGPRPRRQRAVPRCTCPHPSPSGSDVSVRADGSGSQGCSRALGGRSRGSPVALGVNPSANGRLPLARGRPWRT